MTEISNFIGYNAPFILLCLGSYIMWKSMQWIYLSTFIIGFFLNDLLNRIIKAIVQEPRPPNPINNGNYDDWTKTKSVQKYGMPSGHAQGAFYCASFLYFLTKSINVIIGSITLSIITLLHRYIYRKHTAKQLLVGSTIGILTGWIVYYFTFQSLRK